MSISRVDIEDMVKNGLVRDIFKMERSLELVIKMIDRSSELDSKGNGNFTELFSIIHSALKIDSLLAAARVYDTPSKKYPTRCLKGVLEYLSDNKNDLPRIREPYQLQQHLETMNAPQELIMVIKNDPINFAPMFSLFVSSLLEYPSRLDALDKLKQVRDKVIAHNEQTETISYPSIESLRDLINISKDVVGALGWAYFSMGYVINGEYILTDDARRSSVALNRLLDKIYKNNEGT